MAILDLLRSGIVWVGFYRSGASIRLVLSLENLAATDHRELIMVAVNTSRSSAPALLGQLREERDFLRCPATEVERDVVIGDRIARDLLVAPDAAPLPGDRLGKLGRLHERRMRIGDEYGRLYRHREV